MGRRGIRIYFMYVIRAGYTICIGLIGSKYYNITSVELRPRNPYIIIYTSWLMSCVILYKSVYCQCSKWLRTSFR